MDLHVKTDDDIPSAFDASLGIRRNGDIRRPGRPSAVRTFYVGMVSLLALFSWALWFGGIIALFVSVQSLFVLRRPIAGDAASALFLVFGKYQLAVGGLTLIFTVLYYGLRPSRKLVAAFSLFALASVLALYLAVLLIPHMEVLRQQYLAHSPEFSRLHGLSMGLFSAETFLALLGGAFLCLSISGRKP
jgi:hypothetical protein